MPRGFLRDDDLDGDGVDAGYDETAEVEASSMSASCPLEGAGRFEDESGEGVRLRLTPVLDVGSSAVEDNENSGMEYMVAFSSLYIGCGAFSADDANVASEASVMFKARVGLP